MCVQGSFRIKTRKNILCLPHLTPKCPLVFLLYWQLYLKETLVSWGNFFFIIACVGAGDSQSLGCPHHWPQITRCCDGLPSQNHVHGSFRTLPETLLSLYFFIILTELLSLSETQRLVLGVSFLHHKLRYGFVYLGIRERLPVKQKRTVSSPQITT